MIEVRAIECVAGRGIRGDRYFDFKDDYKGQITFFSLDVFDDLCASLGTTSARSCWPVANHAGWARTKLPFCFAERRSGKFNSSGCGKWGRQKSSFPRAPIPFGVLPMCSLSQTILPHAGR